MRSNFGSVQCKQKLCHMRNEWIFLIKLMCKLKTRNRVYMRIRVNNEVIKSKENFPVIAIFLTTSTYFSTCEWEK